MTSYKSKTGVDIDTVYCRKCMQHLPPDNFYECTDAGLIDANGVMSVCKSCIQSLYDSVFEQTQSLEKTIHRLCIALNIRFSNDAVSATRAHIETLQGNGKAVRAIFSIYKMKLTATKRSMSKAGLEDTQYEDIATVYTEQNIDTKQQPIPKELIAFWGSGYTREDILFLESEYTNFKATHSTATYTEIVLLKEVCYTLLEIKRARDADDDVLKLQKGLQELMKSLSISPSATPTGGSGGESDVAIGLWIKDLEQWEPAEWLKNDPRGDMYRDVSNTEQYFFDYFVRPARNFIASSKDFNVEELSTDTDDGFTDDEDVLGGEQDA